MKNDKKKPGATKIDDELYKEKRELEQKKRKLEDDIKKAASPKAKEELEDHLRDIDKRLNSYTQKFETRNIEINAKQTKNLQEDISDDDETTVKEGDYFFHWAYGPLNVIEIYNKYDTQYGCDIDRYILEPMVPKGIVYPIKGTAYPNRRFRKEDIGIWLHRNSEDIYKSPYFAPILAHRSYDIHSA